MSEIEINIFFLLKKFNEKDKIRKSNDNLYREISKKNMWYVGRLSLKILLQRNLITVFVTFFPLSLFALEFI